MKNSFENTISVAQLIINANQCHDFARLHELIEAIAARAAACEICELARHPHPVVQGVAMELLLHLPTHQLALLLADEIDAPQARQALEQQALEYDCDAAQSLLVMWDDDLAGELAAAE